MDITRRSALGAAALTGAALAASHAIASARPDALVFPTTPVAQAARELIDTAVAAPVRNHSLRGYLFARAVAATNGLRAGVDYDDETIYLICALHDIGLGEIANGNQRFEVDGADFAAEFLERHGITDSRVETVWDAIAAHTSGFSDSPVFRRRRPAEIWIAVTGIGIDIGGGPGDLPRGYADVVHAAYPRLGGTPAITAIMEQQILADPRKAFPASLGAELVRLHHPQVPLPNWDDLMNSSGWQD
ncbi:HD domain-containing protein [Nocardia ignorata]|uniref:Metal dependent phosphohydrolase n=1 Tax=Nocardia ignorata TaxID=145285 RepID=A0A4R6P5U0_NOCIG|nr:HD domain-containing protein [Nocardia ignorata]TDP33057.1 metal dependent phosphohydrolase [Nocardia ignorata]